MAAIRMALLPANLIGCPPMTVPGVLTQFQRRSQLCVQERSAKSFAQALWVTLSSAVNLLKRPHVENWKTRSVDACQPA